MTPPKFVLPLIASVDWWLASEFVTVPPKLPEAAAAESLAKPAMNWWLPARSKVPPTFTLTALLNSKVFTDPNPWFKLKVPALT